MPCWYFDKKELRNTPSLLDNIDYETELRYRKEGARFIIDTGTKMDLGYNTMATGVVYFHRFYMFHSFRNFPRYVTACCCLFLAGKVEETPKKCKDIIKTAKLFLTDQKFATFGDDPKEEVMTLERILLQTIKFDVQVEHPYHYLLKYAKCLKGDKAKLQKMVQMAWTFVNDSLCTTLCLQWEPEIIAVALMYLAGKLSKFEVVDWTGRQPKHLRWWDMFIEDVTMDLLEDICHQVLDLYSQSQSQSAPDSPPPARSIPVIDSTNSREERLTQHPPPVLVPSPSVIPIKTSSKSELKLPPGAVVGRGSSQNGASALLDLEKPVGGGSIPAIVTASEPGFPPPSSYHPPPPYTSAPPPLYPPSFPPPPTAPPTPSSAGQFFIPPPGVPTRPPYYPSS